MVTSKTFQDADDSGYPLLLKKSFGYEPTEADVDSGKVLMLFKMEGVDAAVDLNFFDEPSKELPFGRTNYYTATKLYQEAQAHNKKESKKEAKNEGEKKSKN